MAYKNGFMGQKYTSKQFIDRYFRAQRIRKRVGKCCEELEQRKKQEKKAESKKLVEVEVKREEALAAAMDEMEPSDVDTEHPACPVMKRSKGLSCGLG